MEVSSKFSERLQRGYEKASRKGEHVYQDWPPLSWKPTLQGYTSGLDVEVVWLLVGEPYFLRTVEALVWQREHALVLNGLIPAVLLTSDWNLAVQPSYEHAILLSQTCFLGILEYKERGRNKLL